jgi:hypothetical protein
MSPNDKADKPTAIDAVKPDKQPGAASENLPASSPCLLSTGEQDIDPDYLPDYSRKPT